MFHHGHILLLIYKYADVAMDVYMNTCSFQFCVMILFYYLCCLVHTYVFFLSYGVFIPGERGVSVVLNE